MSVDTGWTEEVELFHAGEARRIMDSEVFQKASSDIRDHYLRLWESTQPSEGEIREECWRAVQALEMVCRQLRSVIETGKLAEAAQRVRN